MTFSEYHITILTYFYEQFNSYTSVKDAPADIAGIGYQREFKNCIYQLLSSNLLEKEVQKVSLKLSDDKYRVSKEGRKVILKGKKSEEIKHLILRFLKTDHEQVFRVNDIEEAIPIDRSRIVYLLDEMEEDKNVTIHRVAESDNYLIQITSKGIRNYSKSEYLHLPKKIEDRAEKEEMKGNETETNNLSSMVKYRKPRIFIGSSVEGKNIAEAINANLDFDAWCTIWPHTFGASGITIDSLIRNCTDFDFAIFIFSPDDVAQMRKTTHSVARDNVIFETGLFMGEYGRDRVFVVQPRDIPDFHILTDLSGFTTVTYEAERAIRKEEVRGAVATAASEIQKGIANSTWSMLKLKIKAKSKLEVAGKIHPLKIEIEINNRHPYPVTLQSMDFQLADGLRFAANSSEEQHKPLFLRIEKDCVHKYKEQITIEKGEQVFSCWIPIDESISEEVLKNAIAAKNTGSWRYRCIWIKEHVIVCNYEVQF